jgi:hypothetical protein
MLLLCILSVACGIARGGEKVDDFPEYREFTKVIAKSNRVVVYEGLPHPFEGDVLDKELARKDIFHLHKHPFYKDPLMVKDEDVKRLRAIFENPLLFKQMVEEKLCGGFHPDYCLEFYVAEKRYQVLVCFGCHETKCHGHGVRLDCDIGKDAYPSLVKLLGGYRKHRPKSE